MDPRNRILKVVVETRIGFHIINLKTNSGDYIMNLLDKIFGRKKKYNKEQSVQQNFVKKSISLDDNSQADKRGFVSADKIKVDYNVFNKLKKRYIALDVETTGLSPYSDRIVEVGAVLFENGIPVKSYGTLVNAKASISVEASAVNHITNQMIKNAPTEQEVYMKLTDFLGDALQKRTIICAHNAKFDLNFLSETLMRLGYNAKIYYVDTLSLSRNLIKGIVNYKQETLETYFNLHNKNAHRAKSDAEICGAILWKLLEAMEQEREKSRIAMEKSKPSEEEMEVCAVIHNIITSRNGTTDLLGFYKNSGGYVDVCYLYNIIKFKFAKKGKYIIVAKNTKNIESYTKEPCTMSEGGSDFIRLFFNSPLDLEILGDYIFKEYKNIRKSALEYLSYDDSYLVEYKNGAIMNNALSASDVKDILLTIHSKDYQKQSITIDRDSIIDRSSIEIHPINNRVSVSEIMNLNNIDKGFDMGYPLREKGEEYRKAGDIHKAIDLYDKARYYGYSAPVLFESYAMAFHKLKDYDNEIDILDEGIEREGKLGIKIGRMVTRRNNAIKMLLRKREKEKNKEKKEEVNGVCIGVKSSQKRIGHPVLQLDDEMNIIERFETIAEAVRKTGINSKSIRDTAKGVQKHAGGFIWKYIEEYEKENF